MLVITLLSNSTIALKPQEVNTLRIAAFNNSTTPLVLVHSIFLFFWVYLFLHRYIYTNGE
jgi:hypothetical protein